MVSTLRSGLEGRVRLFGFDNCDIAARCDADLVEESRRRPRPCESWRKKPRGMKPTMKQLWAVPLLGICGNRRGG